jgi:hypothetical protein
MGTPLLHSRSSVKKYGGEIKESTQRSDKKSVLVRIYMACI